MGIPIATATFSICGQTFTVRDLTIRESERLDAKHPERDTPEKRKAFLYDLLALVVAGGDGSRLTAEEIQDGPAEFVTVAMVTLEDAKKKAYPQPVQSE